MLFLRSIVASYAEADVRAGDDLVKQIRVYPLSKARTFTACACLRTRPCANSGL